MNELEQITEELEELRNQMDDVVDSLSIIIIDIAANNDEFVCSTCLNTAKELYRIFKNIARDEDCDSICEQYANITGRDLDE